MINKTILNKEKLLASSIKKRSIEFNKSFNDNEMAYFLKNSEDYLSTPEWFLLKAQIIAFHGINCMRCKKTPKKWNDIQVDHIKPRKLFPSLFDSPNNLQILCPKCNKSKGNKHDTDYRFN